MYDLDWPPAVLDELAAIYVAVDVPVRERLAGMVEKLNTDLRHDPLSVGESRNGPLRVVIRAGLTVYFGVTGRKVRVVQVRYRGL
jgi:hypothetical protein